ncbi:MAG: NADP-specific glutamate dehydrogenase [Gammaproteobacteria bacterium]|nr:NADP-specific glutamate dehydrogenase [Gammaproteobacteria bacterium]
MSEAIHQDVYQWLEQRNPNQNEFNQAVTALFDDLIPLVAENREYQRQQVLKRLTEPDRIISFRVVWEDDNGELHVNRGYRVQHCGLLGPYKGGIRFHPLVNESVLKFLAFEQTFKNALTNLPLGGGKGGADFDPKGRSDREIMRFCQAYMNELYRHIGENTDVPAGDINVGSREIGFLFGQYRRLANKFSGTFTGKNIEFGGSHVRMEATGFGLIYFVENMLKKSGESLADKDVAISGAGNVALHAALKAAEKKARVITLSNSHGSLYCIGGIEHSIIEKLLDSSARPDLEQLAHDIGGHWREGEKPWNVACDIALPCGTQNELDEDDAKQLVNQGCQILAEGANMPCTIKAIDILNNAKIANAPGKASNAGGVALSGLEMSQNASFTSLSYEELDEKLNGIMHSIHQQCVDHGNTIDGWVNYRKGANIAAFNRLAASMLSQGIA